ncbi:MAG: PIN domain-containing protein [Chloroflexi bacterium]|nr:PIN domain-containing protein [Chloroflexota bacterium]
MVLIDTSVWIQAFRYDDSAERREVDSLLARREAVLAGAVLAEVLQGARNQQEFQRLRDRLTALPYLEETQETWVRAGRLSYQLRGRGVTVGLVDLLIAALAAEHGCAVYTRDEHLPSIPGLALHAAG